MKKTKEKEQQKLPQPVIVSWVDSASKDDWMAATDADRVVVGQIDSLGWLVSEGKDDVRIASHVDTNDGTLGYVLIIPRVAVKRIRRIKL